MRRAIVAFSILIMTVEVCGINQTEHDLHRHLFHDYNPDVLPVINRSEAIDVSMDLFLYNIEGIDEKQQTFSIRGYLEIKWKNVFLKWIPEEYADIKTISVPNTKIWTPDLGLSNVYDNPSDIGQAGRAKVDYDGLCAIWPYKVYTVACKITIRKFPFDVQSCVLAFHSWTLPTSVQKISTSDKPSLHGYEENSEWAMDSFTVQMYQEGYEGMTYDNVVFRFTLRRKWIFHLLNMIVPIVCISLLNITCFVTPSESGERISLSISIFLTLAVFLTIISSSLPESSDEISLFSVYVGLQLVCSGLTILATIVSLGLFHKDPKETVGLCYRVLSKLLCLGSLNSTKGKVYIKPNGQILNDGAMSKANRESYNEMTDVTWITVSRAFDRLCLVLSIVWNIGLSIILIYAFGA